MRARSHRLVSLIAAAALIGTGALVAVAAPSSADSAWFVDPVSAPDRAKEIAVPDDPTQYSGKQRYTVALYRTHAGTLAVPARTAVGHRLETGQALVLDGGGYFRFNIPKLTQGAKKQMRALKDALTNVRGIACEGYADYDGPKSNERMLGIKRAANTCNYLRRVAPQITTATTSAYAANHPVIVGGSRPSREENRRAVIVITAVAPSAAPTPAPPTNRPPVARADANSLATGIGCGPRSATGNVISGDRADQPADKTGKDSDPDGDALVVTSPGTYTGAHGNLSLMSSGAYTYQWNGTNNTSGSDAFTYTVSDGRGGTSTATLTVAFTYSPCLG